MSLLADNTRRAQAVKFKPSFEAAAKKFAVRALSHKEVYVEIADEIKRRYNKHIPWWFIPLVHERECIGGVNNFNCNIAQGAAYNQKSKDVPYNGPFPSFKEAAIAALVKEAPHAAQWTNWSAGGVATIAEQYNGMGYARMGKSSPYVWSGTDQYVHGKYVADHKYRDDVVDTQLGVMVSLHAMMELDPSIVLGDDVPNQEKTQRKVETAVVGTTMSTILASINDFVPGYDLSWLDVTGIAVGVVIVASVVIYFINKYKRGQIQ